MFLIGSEKRVRSAALVAGALGLLFAVTPALYAQDAEGQDADDQTRPSYVLEREVFDYPSEGRRDPFRELNPTTDVGPRFDDLELAGILHSPTVGSVAVLVDRLTKKRYRVWEGERVGGARLLRVRPTEVDFLVTVFGISRRETLTVKRQEEEL
ncbi:MAG: hypothetical protein ABFS14_09350 [Gemmatimonadota bacterium]